jgi:adenosylmethionine-8-amino-7-oxononanoate aminotransferase
MHKLAQLDHRYIWHPFTQMQDWLKSEPIVIVEGRGAVLQDARGREYLDANASIWTNLHGHNHPRINAAITRQFKKIAHSSALGLANEPASLLAEKLVQAANVGRSGTRHSRLEKVFFSDDGSTAMEVALKLAYEFARRVRHDPSPRFLSFAGAYHGDTVGAVSLGHIDLFHKSYRGLLFKTDSAPAPYCYRCPFNRAKPERADARDYRKCGWECVGLVEKKFGAQKKKGRRYAGLIVEPLMQGAAGMIAQPQGWLRALSEIAGRYGTPLIADEVMTGFGRTGLQTNGAKGQRTRPQTGGSLFACHQEGVQPDFLAVAKGLTGGYLPMAATLTTQEVFDAFLGDYSEFKTFFHGHSFTANQLGSAAALESLAILESTASIRARHALQAALGEQLQTLWALPNVGDIRQAGLVAGVELVKDWRTRAPFDLRERAGIRVCEAMARRGVLTRPIGNVVVLMPPYCTTPSQLKQMILALRDGIVETLMEPFSSCKSQECPNSFVYALSCI